LDDVTAEVHDDGSFADGNGNLIIEGDIDETETEVSTSEEVLFLPEVSENNISATSIRRAVSSRSSSGIVDLDSATCYKVTVAGQQFTAYFPDSAVLKVVDGYLVNMGSSVVTGLLISGDSSSVDLATYQDYYLTLNSVLSTGSNSNVYRYGGYSYLTHYYINGSYGLTSEQTYSLVQVNEQPSVGSEFSSFQIAVLGLLLFLCLVEVLGGVLRR
jgi:hypothetical protein